jgi:FtsP/CotA-like multicopper oxidase with cupredoxin domain
MRTRLPLGLLTIAFFAACGDDPVGNPGPPELATLTDLDPAPDVVEVQIVAAPATAELLPGKTADVWAYRDGAVADAAGTIPGPMLEAHVGDQVIVHFRNELPEETTIHWHGLRVPNTADGTPASQAPVAPGASFDYLFTVEDPGLFWYHPHVRGDVQIERGLHAPLRVLETTPPPVAADRVFVLDDVKIEATGQLSTTTDQLDIMLGRQGNVLLVNGMRDRHLAAAAGARERWRFVNAANGRYFHLALPDRRFLVIGWDGGLLPEPYESETLLIAPGERYDVIVELGGAEGDVVVLRNVYYDRGHDIPDPGPQDLMTVELGAPAPALPGLPDTWGDVEPIPVDGATAQRSFLLEESDDGPEPVFSINGEQFPAVTPVSGTSGAVEVWEVVNDTEMDHPFHLHGMFFQVLDVDGVAAPRLGWKDTVNVPRDKRLRFAVRYGEPGHWMFHCHILEHAERGMMGELELSPP